LANCSIKSNTESFLAIKSLFAWKYHLQLAKIKYTAKISDIKLIKILKKLEKSRYE